MQVNAADKSVGIKVSSTSTYTSSQTAIGGGDAGKLHNFAARSRTLVKFVCTTPSLISVGDIYKHFAGL
jgi:hypothetical protein